MFHIRSVDCDICKICVKGGCRLGVRDMGRLGMSSSNGRNVTCKLRGFKGGGLRQYVALCFGFLLLLVFCVLVIMLLVVVCCLFACLLACLFVCWWIWWLCVSLWGFGCGCGYSGCCLFSCLFVCWFVCLFV